MTDNKTYPKISETSWWALRSQFQKTLPPTLSPTYLAPLLKISTASAKVLLPALKQVGLIDNDNKTTTRANDWRTDAKYPEVCKAIREEVYPQELRDLFSDTSDREGIKSWFAHTGLLGDVAARQSASLYALLTDATIKAPDDKPIKQKSNSPKKAVNGNSKNNKDIITDETAATIQTPISSISTSAPQFTPNNSQPTLHIDLQIHISPDASLEQIDTIFASMAKHLYK